MGELSETFKLFGLESEDEIDEEMRRRGRPKNKQEQKYGHSKRQYEHEHYGSDDQYYNALNPLPINYTNDHRIKPKIKKNHKDDYDERQAIALSDSVIKEVRAEEWEGGGLGLWLVRSNSPVASLVCRSGRSTASRRSGPCTGGGGRRRRPIRRSSTIETRK